MDSIKHIQALKQCRAIINNLSRERDLTRVHVMIEDAVPIMQTVMANRSQTQESVVEVLHAQGLATTLLTEVAYFLNKQGLLETVYQIAPDPSLLSQAIISAFNFDDKAHLSMAREAVRLGGVLSRDLLYNATRFIEDNKRELPVDLCKGIIENIIRSPWALGSDEEHDYTVSRFVSSMMASLARRKQSPFVVRTLLSNNELIRSLVPDFKLCDYEPQLSAQYEFLAYVTYRACIHELLVEINRQAPHAYDLLMRQHHMLQAISYEMLTPRHDSFDLGKLPHHPSLTAQFCLDLFVEGIRKGQMSERRYRGIQKKWEEAGQEGEIAKKARSMAPMVKMVKRYKAYQAFLSSPEVFKAGFSKKHVEYSPFEGDNSIFEKQYIKPSERIDALDETRQRHMSYVLYHNQPDDLVKNLLAQRADLSSPTVVQTLFEMVTDVRSSERAVHVGDQLIKAIVMDKEINHVLSHVSKEDFDCLFGEYKGADAHALKRIRWKDPLILRQMLESDLDL